MVKHKNSSMLELLCIWGSINGRYPLNTDQVYISKYGINWASQVAQWLKSLPVTKEIQETQFLSLGQEELLEEGVATHSSILAWRIPRTESLAVYNPYRGKESDMTGVTGKCIHDIN